MKRPLRFLIASTRQWNPGDEWIAYGIRRLFARAVPRDHISWLLYDRSPDAFDRPWDAEARPRRAMANSWAPEFDCPVDAVILAGTPEWYGAHLRPVFERFADSSVPLFFLGIGHISDHAALNAIETSILRRAFITVRDELAEAALAAHGIGSELLPCPSLFSSPCEAPTRRLRSIAVVLQTSRVVNQSIPAALEAAMLALVAELARTYEVSVVCNYIDEYCRFSPVLDCPVLYSYDSTEYFEILSRFDMVISTRLHSGFVANSLGKLAIVTHDTPRVSAARQQFPFIYGCAPEEVPARLASVDLDGESRRLFNWKRTVETDYVHLLSNALTRYGLHSV